MNRAEPPSVNAYRAFRCLRSALLGLCLAGLAPLPAAAQGKEGMPDLGQIEQTCLPTSTANLIVWFGLHGYPKLIVAGDNKDDGYIHTVHRIMDTTDARFDWGTAPDMIVVGIKKYIEDAGYSCDVEYRGLSKAQFTQDWLKENDDPNKGFVLLLAYTAHNAGNDTYTNAFNAGHAVTLVNAMPDMILVHDPAHDEDQSGRKILTPQPLTSGTFVSRTGDAPVAGLMMLSGSQLEAPPDADVMLIGAVCITMHSPGQKPSGRSSDSSDGPTSSVGSSGSASPATAPAAPVSATKSWVEWLFDLLFSK